VCGEPAVDVSASRQQVRQIKEAKTGGAAPHDKPWLCSDASHPLSVDLIRGNRRITTNDTPCRLVKTVVDVFWLVQVLCSLDASCKIIKNLTLTTVH